MAEIYMHGKDEDGQPAEEQRTLSSFGYAYSGPTH